ncbi:MAG: polysaccharide deacetylase family protein [Planctomycetes bacterium]|nr:polysaccharide deacetylase family protein [Planctomycetota bacterium]
MPSPLHVAIPAAAHPYWRAALQRSGVPTASLDANTGPESTLFLPDAGDHDSPAQRQHVVRLHRAGAPVLAGTAWAQTLDMPTRLHWFGSADPGAVLAARTTPAPLAILDLPSAERLLRPAASLARRTGPGGLAVREVLADVDHGALRRRVERALCHLAHTAGRPFARFAHHPGAYRQTLAIRIDADGFRAAATAALRASLQRANLRSTWFVDVERHARGDGLAGLADLAADGHELQSHGFRHYTYRSRARNERNLRRSAAALAAFGVRATATAAPFGTWNPGFEQAVRALGWTWSSEFSRVHDDVPGPLGGTPDEPWQVPVHPICPALLFAAGAGVAEVHAWFLAELAACRERGEPAVFYGHPIDDLERCPDLLPELAVAARAAGPLWQPTLGELVAFHRERSTSTLTARSTATGIEIESSGPAALQVQMPDGSEQWVLGRGTAAALEPAAAPNAADSALLVPQPRRRVRADRAPLRTKKLQLARLWRELKR